MAKLYTVSICPDTEILHIRKRTIIEAQRTVFEYYPDARIMEVVSHIQYAIYDGNMYHVGNIWYE